MTAEKGNARPGPAPRLLDPAAYAASPARRRFAALCAYFSRAGAWQMLDSACHVTDTQSELSSIELNGIM